MLRYTISNKLMRGNNQRVPQNLDNPKNGQALDHGWALGNLPSANSCIKSYDFVSIISKGIIDF